MAKADDTNASYFVLEAHRNELVRAIRLPQGYNECHLQALALRHADVLSHVPGHAEFSVSRINPNPPVCRIKPDLVVSFFGAASFDVIELKRPDETLQKKDGLTSLAVHEGVQQLIKYDKAITELGGVMIGKMKLCQPTPSRLVLVIGRSNSDGAPVNLVRIQDEVRFHYSDQLPNAKRLEIWTWDTIAEALSARVEAVRTHASVDKINSNRRCDHAAARTIISRLVDKQSKVSRRVDPSKLTNDASTPAIACPEVPDAVVTSEEKERVTAIAGQYAKLVASFAGPNKLTLNDYHAAMELASIVLYERDGDLPWRFWEHAGTWGTVDFLKALPERVRGRKLRRDLLDGVSKGLIAVMSLDSSEGCIGACAHIGRTFCFMDLGLTPKGLLERMNHTQSPRGWSAMEKQLAAASVSGDAAYNWFIPATHVAYLRAMLGERSAADLLTACVANADSVQRLTVYNAAHSYRNPIRLQTGMLEKASNPLPYLEPLVPYHKALSTAFAPVCRSMETLK